MVLPDIPFGTTAWFDLPATEHPGESGMATWRTREFGTLRVRVVDYSPGYRADHWCRRGHILFVLEGTLITELAGGEEVTLRAGDGYQVGDDVVPHRSRTDTGARLYIVDRAGT